MAIDSSAIPGRLATARTAWLVTGTVCLTFVMCIGCSSGEKVANRKPVFPVDGQMLFHGAPIDGAMISFFPVSDSGTNRSVPSQTRSKADGTFQLNTYMTSDGAPEGEYVVTIYWPGKRPAGGEHTDDGDDSQLPPDRLQGRFATTAKSNLRARVSPQPTNFATLDLSDSELAKSREFHLREK